MEEGLRILELVQDIKNTYVKAKLEDKAKILKILSSNCTLMGASVTFHWNRPFDILFKLGQSKEKGELIVNFRTFLRQTSIVPIIQQLSQLTA